MIGEIQSTLGVTARIDWQPEQAGDVPQTWADIEKGRQLLKYEPRTRFSDGIATFADWLVSSETTKLSA